MSPTYQYYNQRYQSGAILIYVLWILVVISALAFQLAESSRIVVVNQAASSKQLKHKIQVKSALQFAMFQIRKNEWHDQNLLLKLNDQAIKIRIFNESGYIPIYKLSSKSLKNVFKFVNIDFQAIEKLEEVIESDEKPRSFNSFVELLEFNGFNESEISRLIPYISIFHRESANPYYAATEVLKLLPGIDLFRVEKLLETEAVDEKIQLREELVESFTINQVEVSEDPSLYYRIIIELDGIRHFIFVLMDPAFETSKVVLSFTQSVS